MITDQLAVTGLGHGALGTIPGEMSEMPHSVASLQWGEEELEEKVLQWLGNLIATVLSPA